MSVVLAVVCLAGPAIATTRSLTPAESPPTIAASRATDESPIATSGPLAPEVPATASGATETMRISVADPDGDEVTLRAGTSMLGVQPTVTGLVITYPSPTDTTGKDGFPLTASDGRGGEAYCEFGALIQAAGTDPSATPQAPSAAPLLVTVQPPTPSPTRRVPAAPDVVPTPTARADTSGTPATTDSGTDGQTEPSAGTLTGPGAGTTDPVSGTDAALAGTAGALAGTAGAPAVIAPGVPAEEHPGSSATTAEPTAAAAVPSTPTGASGWLFAGVGGMLVALVVLAGMCLPRSR